MEGIVDEHATGENAAASIITATLLLGAAHLFFMGYEGWLALAGMAACHRLVWWHLLSLRPAT
jgi:hypothetical protein